MERTRTRPGDRETDRALMDNYLRLVRYEVKQMLAKHAAAGTVAADDLFSAGQLAVVEVIRRYPLEDEYHFLSQLRNTVRSRLVDELRKLTGGGKGRAGRQTLALPTEPDGRLVAVHDRRQHDPGEIAAAAEGLPDPAEVRARAVRLRMAMLSAVTAEDLAAVVQKQVQKAKDGNDKSAELLFKLYGGG